MDKTVTETTGRLPLQSFWAKQVHICEEKHLFKSIIQARTNPDYKINHPAECKNLAGFTVHPEAKVRILKELAKKIKSITPPPVIRPNRYNRS